jgi:hypothetical protein
MNVFECLSYMSYIYTRKHHKEDSLGQEINFRKSSVRGSIPKDSSVRGSIPKDSSVRGSNPRWKYTFVIDDKGGDIYQMEDKERAHRHDSRESMSDMNSLLHQSVSINSKRGYFLLIGLVFIDFNP